MWLEWADETLKGKRDDQVFLGWVNRPKGKVFDSRLVLLSKFRLYVATSKYKVGPGNACEKGALPLTFSFSQTEREAHIAEIKSIESSASDNVRHLLVRRERRELTRSRLPSTLKGGTLLPTLLRQTNSSITSLQHTRMLSQACQKRTGSRLLWSHPLGTLRPLFSSPSN